MSAEQITALINLGAAAAVIIVVVYFLKFQAFLIQFIEKRDQDWQAFFRALLADKDSPLPVISENLMILLSEFRAHDQMERTKLEEMSKVVHANEDKPQKKIEALQAANAALNEQLKVERQKRGSSR